MTRTRKLLSAAVIASAAAGCAVSHTTPRRSATAAVLVSAPIATRIAASAAVPLPAVVLAPLLGPDGRPLPGNTRKRPAAGGTMTASRGSLP